MGYLVRRLSEELDRNRFYGSAATDDQITAVRIYLQTFTGRDDQRRYHLIYRLFGLKAVPDTSKLLTRGQASALIALSRHEQYGPALEVFIDSMGE